MSVAECHLWAILTKEQFEREWVARKTNVVRRFGKSSFLVGRELAIAGKTVTEKYSVPEAQYATHGGAFPLRIKVSIMMAILSSNDTMLIDV